MAAHTGTVSRFREKLTKKLVRAFVRSLGVEHVVADYRKRLDRVGAVDRQNQMLLRLGSRNGYRLVGCDQHRINAFFVHRGIGGDVVPEVDPAPHTSARPAPIPDGWVQV